MCWHTAGPRSRLAIGCTTSGLWPASLNVVRRWQIGTAASDDAAGAASCEVDVVAQDGHAWIEVKSHRSFGTQSQHWLGSSGHTKGVRSAFRVWQLQLPVRRSA